MKVKTKESKDSTANLCDHCICDFPNCTGNRIRFGDGLGHDNIRGCTGFVEEKTNPIAYQEIELTEDEFNSVYQD